MASTSARERSPRCRRGRPRRCSRRSARSARSGASSWSISATSRAATSIFARPCRTRARSTCRPASAPIARSDTTESCVPITCRFPSWIRTASASSPFAWATPRRCCRSRETREREMNDLPTQPVRSAEAPRLIRMHANDNVAIVANDSGLAAGTWIDAGVTLRERVPQAHKVALVDIAKGAPVRRYNVVIGYAAEALPAGSWVNEARLVMPTPPALDSLPIATDNAPLAPPLAGHTFDGFRNPDGSVGTRNILGITTTVQCVAGVVDHAVRRIRSELLPKYPNVDDVVALEHIYGCGVAIDAPDAEIPIRTLRNISYNPNFGGGCMVVSLGCEKLQPERLLPAGARDYDLVVLQDPAHDGFDAMIASIMRTAEQHLRRLDARRRESCPASALVVGMQCGGSDAFSGVTANPALGFASDLLVRAGATVMFSENT